MKNKIWILAALFMFSIGQASAAQKITYFHLDGLGSPVAATDESGNLAYKEAYLPYGERVRKEDNGKNSLWYTGKQEDADNGLTYFGARWYDPTIGRFMGIDPAGVQEDNIHSFNRFAYANNNPYKFVDPDGLNPKLIIDFGLNLALNYITTGKLGVGVALKDTIVGALNPMATLNKFKKFKSLVTNSPLARGRAAEQRVLNDLGLSKNTHKVRTGEGVSIPDALTKRQAIEIKDCISVSCTKQIRIQTEAARRSGRQSTLITGDKTRVSGPAQRAFDNIIRRSDLGPQ